MKSGKKSEETLLMLEAAKRRILDGQPERIAKGRKLSVSACEKEAGLGDGSAYYYKEFVVSIKNEKSALKAPQTKKNPNSEVQCLKEEIKDEKGKKNNYRNQLKTSRERIKQMAKDQTQMTDALISSRAKIIQLQRELSEERKKNITRIK